MVPLPGLLHSSPRQYAGLFAGGELRDFLGIEDIHLLLSIINFGASAVEEEKAHAKRWCMNGENLKQVQE